MDLDMYLYSGIAGFDYTNKGLNFYPNEKEFKNLPVPQVVKNYATKEGPNYYNLFKEEGYWRKANAIHKWFVDNCQKGVDDCGIYPVSKEHIESLLQACKEDSLEPTSEFFFCSTDKDDWYYKDLKTTKKLCKKILKNFDFNNYQLYYQSSW